MAADLIYFATVVTEARLTADRSVFAPEATGFFCDWRDRSTDARRAKFICDWRERSKIYRRLKQYVRRSQFLATEVTAAQLTTHRRVFEPGATKYFATGVTEIQVTADRCLFATGLSEAYVTADRSFVPNATKSLCEWRGRSTSVRRTKFICDLARTKQK